MYSFIFLIEQTRMEILELKDHHLNTSLLSPFGKSWRVLDSQTRSFGSFSVKKWGKKGLSTLPGCCTIKGLMWECAWASLAKMEVSPFPKFLRERYPVGEGDIRGLKGNGKNAIKTFF